MTTTYTTTTTGRAGFPLRTFFVPFPFVCFTLTLVTDIAYWRTSFLMWNNFSSWLLFFGLLLGAVGLVAGALDMLRRSTRIWGPGWAAAIGYVLMLAVAVVNSFVHAGDGWTAIVPNGLILSVVTFVLAVLTVLFAARRRSRVIWSVER
jgi:Predicted membrane protein